jgi:uncharacterized protein YjaZ
MGYFILQSYLKDHGDVPIAKWTDMDAEEILVGSE